MNVPAETSNLKLRWGAGLWILAVVQYLVAQIVVARAWTTPYSWTGNFISDLGNTACGRFAVPHGPSSYVCSPQHWVMNASFIAAGLLGGVGVLLLRRFWPARRMVTVGVALWLAAAAGKIIVGVVPENANVGLHTLGALNIPLGSIAILLLGRSVLHNGGWLRTTGIVLSCLGLVGTALSVAGQYSGSAAYLGMGAGGAERLASYPGNLWMLIIGAIVVMTPSVGRAGRTSGDRTKVTVDAPG
jgi:hypothetical membrane protein